MRAVFSTLALAALSTALPTGLDSRQFEVGDPETSFPPPITAPPVTMPPDLPVILPPISGPIQIGKRDEAKRDDFIIFPPKVGGMIPDKPVCAPIHPGKRDEAKRDDFIIFPPKVGPMIPDKPVNGHVKLEPTVPGGPLKPST